MKLVMRTKIEDGYDFLLKTAACERECAETILSQEELWKMDENDYLLFVELFDDIEGKGERCIGRCVLNANTIYGLIIYHPYRNKGYCKKLIAWLMSNTPVYNLTTRNIILSNLLCNMGWSIVGSKTDNYTGHKLDIVETIQPSPYRIKANELPLDKMSGKDVFEQIGVFDKADGVIGDNYIFIIDQSSDKNDTGVNDGIE